jgi:hypothetical protein
MKKTLLFFAVASCTALAQITITSGDVNNMFAVGNSATIHQDDLITTVDIGSPGGGNMWDFTMLQSSFSVDLESVDPASTPYIGDFLGADICTYSFGFSQGTQADIWSYSTLNGTFDNMGSGISVSPDTVFKLINNLPEIQAEFPMTFNTNWMQTYTQSMTIEINGIPLFTIQSTIDKNVSVDAYGSMTLPGGANFDALRLREERTVTLPPLPGITSVSYTFLAKNGAQVSVSAADANPPNSGTINVDGVSYNGSMTTTSVEQISGLPNDYYLSQNYPNPFNPSTNIEYSIPSESFVELKVYDVLGNEIASLVNEQQQAGVYRADFTADNLPSGMYFARITANDFSQVIKMILLK